MKWFSVNYVKSNPWLFVGIVVVFGLIFWFLLNRGSSSGSGTTVVTQGQSEAELAANTQMALAQIQAGMASQQGQLQLAAIQEQGDIALAIATMDAAYKTQSLGVERDVAELNIAAQVKALELNMQQSRDNNQFAVDYARLAYDSALETTQINAELQRDLSADAAGLQRDLSAQQLEAFKLSSLLSVLPSLKKKNRDETLQIIAGGALGNPVDYRNTPNGTWITGSTRSTSLPPAKYVA